MTLRARLIVAFLALSVLPLGVVTFYTYTTSVEAMRDVAAREADLLAAVLNQRMQVITSQLSDRIEHLIDMTAPEPAETPTESVATTTSPATRETTRTSATHPVQPVPTQAPSPGAAMLADIAEQEQMSHRVADALGEAAVLLNTVNVQGMGRLGQFPSRLNGPGGPSRSGGQGADAAASRGSGPPPRRDASSSQPAPALRPPPPSTSGTPPPASGAPNLTPPGAPPGVRPPPTSVTPGTPASAAVTADPRVFVTTDNGMKIDLTQIRHDLYRQILPSTTAEQLTPEERQRVAREVNQRMLGIVEGIKLSAAELQKQADEARKAAASASRRSQHSTGSAASSAAAATAAGPVAPPAPGATTPAPAQAPTPPPPPPPASSATPAPTAVSPAPGTASAMPVVTRSPATMAPLKRTAEFSGNQLNVKFERNGQVVRTVNAEINLPNMLMAVLSSTPSEQGEVPFAVDKDGKVYTRTDEEKRRVEAFGAAATPSGQLGKTVLPDWIVVTTAGPTGTGLRFGIARPTGDSIAALRRTAGRNVGFGLLFIAVALVGVVPLSSRLTRNLTNLTEGVSRIAKGDYAARVNVRSHDEVGALATAFNHMAADVERHQRAVGEQERMKRELELGRQIQHDMLPQGTLRLGLTEIKGVSVPAREVGGDFFNYFELANGHIAMLVGDVSGKGVGPALLMANIQASIRTRLSLGQDLTAVADEIDHEIDRNATETLYATLFISVLDPVTRKLRYVNCGHHPQFVLRRAGGLERMASTGVPVGLLVGRGYSQLEVQLEAGDRLFFYTDGCVEAENEAGDFFGADRLEAALAAGDGDPGDVLANVERVVERFRGARELLDDVTVMAVRVG
jgi:serine phosphatase RsbU (regulator of sigma subunit)